MPTKSDTDTAAGGATAETADSDLQEAVVARGVVVWGDNVTSGPGETVQLSAADVVKLRADGVLVDPAASGAPAPAPNGPSVGAE